MGNGGWAGNLSYPNMGEALAAGYATASTDTGHVNDGSPDASFAYKHPEKMLDFGFRALHETTVTGKNLIKAFYPQPRQGIDLQWLLDRRPPGHECRPALSDGL